MGLSDGTLIWKKFGRSLEEEKVEENKDFFPDYFKGEENENRLKAY